MKRIAPALIAAGMFVFFISMVAPVSGQNSRWRNFFLKDRLTEVLKKHRYLVVWETRDRTALPPHLGEIMQKNDSSPIDDSALRRMTAEGLRIIASGAIHFIEVEGTAPGSSLVSLSVHTMVLFLPEARRRLPNNPSVTALSCIGMREKSSFCISGFAWTTD